jgi:hypothetical protein
MRLDVVQTPVRKQLHELTRVEVLAERRQARDRDSEAGPHCADRHFSAVDGDLPLRLHLDLLIASVEQQLFASHWSCNDKIMLGERFRRLRNAVGLKIRRRRCDDQRPASNETRDRARIGQLAEPDRDVDPFLDQVLPPIIDGQLDLEVRMSGNEGSKPGNNGARRNDGRHGYPQCAA